VLLNHTFVEEGNMTFTINVSGFQLKSVVHLIGKNYWQAYETRQLNKVVKALLVQLS